MGISIVVLWICGNYLKSLWEQQANKTATLSVTRGHSFRIAEIVFKNK